MLGLLPWRCATPVTVYFLVMNLKKSRHSNSNSSHCMPADQQQQQQQQQQRWQQQ
jgi:hypothetical protein